MNPTHSARSFTSIAVLGFPVLAAMAAGCGGQARPERGAGGNRAPAVASASEAVLACPTDKISFSRENGCQNDGAVEFCVPAGDLALQARIEAVDSDVTFIASAGRAHCDVATELLGMYPIHKGPGGDCDVGDGLRWGTWNNLCVIAAEAGVRRIVPTFFE